MFIIWTYIFMYFSFLELSGIFISELPCLTVTQGCLHKNIQCFLTNKHDFIFLMSQRSTAYLWL